LLCPSTEKKDKILSAHNQIDADNLLSNVLKFSRRRRLVLIFLSPNKR
jgi:hypothetical protein